MIYVTAQPDHYYFTWQLELQLYNLATLGVMPERIHVLVGYDPARGLSESFRRIFESNPNGRFFSYPDGRVGKGYEPSLRPHILAQHFSAFPRLSEEVIFYMDSDVVFRELPDEALLSEGDCWYASDTRDYLDSGY